MTAKAITISAEEAADLVRFMDRRYLHAETYPALKALIDRLNKDRLGVPR